MVSTRANLDSSAPDEVVYPDSDGQPMAENTEQFEWIVTLQGNLDALRPDFVGGDLLWYPVEGRPEIRVAPDVLVAPGRPKGRRGSYIQHREGGVPPKVVIEVLSPGNSTSEMVTKGFFYQRYGVDEFIIVDPATQDGSVYVRNELGNYEWTDTLHGWTSPCLGIRFESEDGRLEVFRPDGTPFRTFLELTRALTEVTERAEQEAQRAEQEAQRAEQEAQRAERLAAKLRELGVDPDA